MTINASFNIFKTLNYIEIQLIAAGLNKFGLTQSSSLTQITLLASHAIVKKLFTIILYE